MAGVSEFSTTDGGHTYVRKLFGHESSICTYNEVGDGLFFYTGSCSVQLPPTIKQDQLREFMTLSWVRLRYMAPFIGLRTFRRPGDTDWFVEYHVPRTPAEAETWANDVIIWHEEELPMMEWDVRLKQRMWMPSAGHPAIELHVGPESSREGKWHLSIHGPHGMIDGRMAMALIDQMLLILEDYVHTSKLPEATEIDCGTEVERLHGCAASCVDGFESILAAAGEDPSTPPAPPPGFIPFLPPPIENHAATYNNTSRLIKLSTEQTKKFRALCKLHGRTVTQVVDCILMVADTEASLMAAKAQGPERWKAVVNIYEQATDWLIALTFKDQRPSFPRHSALIPRSSPPFAVDGFSFSVDMAPIRKASDLDKESQTFRRDTSDAVFWDGLVQTYVETRDEYGVDHESYVKREYRKQESSKNIDMESMRIRAFVSSSLGDVDSMDVFTDALPSAEGNTKRRIKVIDIGHGVRIGLPIMVCVYWQFKGQLAFHFHTGARYQTEAEMDMIADTFDSWLKVLA